mmetsp:Transcript_20644/g.30453  ORF Transcript_20644/g.30453 Transcript_20644/m.30453 type:complete len:330 (-) Transcript_20644:261-1250(-)
MDNPKQEIIDNTDSGNDTTSTTTTAYQELKWTDRPLFCPEDVISPVEADHAVTEDPPRLPITAGSTALLIVDVQPEYWSACPAVRKDFPNFEENLARTIAIARKQRAKIIWVRADYRKHHSPWLAQFERLSRGKRPDTQFELPCEPDSDEFAWEDFATPEGGESIIAKSSWSSTSNTALMDILKVSGIDSVLVCGLITSVCVQHSAFGVFEAGYRTLLVEDSCGDRGRARHDAALALYGGYMYELISSTELADPVNGLQKAKPVWITMEDVNSTGPKNKGPRDRSVSNASLAEVSVGVETITTRKRTASNDEVTDEGSADVDGSRPRKK